MRMKTVRFLLKLVDLDEEAATIAAASAAAQAAKGGAKKKWQLIIIYCKCNQSLKKQFKDKVVKLKAIQVPKIARVCGCVALVARVTWSWRTKASRSIRARQLSFKTTVRLLVMKIDINRLRCRGTKQTTRPSKCRLSRILGQSRSNSKISVLKLSLLATITRNWSAVATWVP